MPTKFLIEWMQGPAKGCVDVLPFKLFGEVAQDKVCSHEVIPPRGNSIAASFTMNVSDDSAELRYAGENRNLGIMPGVLKILFKDRTRTEIQEVLWSDLSGSLSEPMMEDQWVRVHLR